MTPGDRVRVRPLARGTSLGGYVGTVSAVAPSGDVLVLLDGDARPLLFGAAMLEPADAVGGVTGECADDPMTGAE